MANQAKVAIQFVINYEEGGEHCLLNGDPHSESYLSEIDTSPLSYQRHLSMESLYEYGSRAGFWRLHRLFTRYNIPVTVFAITAALQKNPDVITAMQAANWEIACHGLKWIDYKPMHKMVEQQQILKAVSEHTRLTGEKPQGWYIGRSSINTRSLLIEYAQPLYESNSYADDLPFWCYEYQQPLLIIPYSLDTNDMNYFTSKGFSTGKPFYQYLKDAFDYLYKEASINPKAAKMLSIGLHSRISGRPGRTAAIEKFLNYTSNFNDIWITRRIDVAHHWWATHPPKSI